MSKQVTCITKREHHNPHERIQGIGGVDGGVRWWRAEDDAISDVERDATSYYVSVNGKSVGVVVATHNGRKYLKTQTDDYAHFLLLAQRRTNNVLPVDEERLQNDAIGGEIAGQWPSALDLLFIQERPEVGGVNAN